MSLWMMCLPTFTSRQCLIGLGQALTERAGLRRLFCDTHVHVTLVISGKRNSSEKNQETAFVIVFSVWLNRRVMKFLGTWGSAESGYAWTRCTHSIAFPDPPNHTG